MTRLFCEVCGCGSVILVREDGGFIPECEDCGERYHLRIVGGEPRERIAMGKFWCVKYLRATGAGNVWRTHTSELTGSARFATMQYAEKVALRLGRDDGDIMSLVVVEIRPDGEHFVRWYDRAGETLVRNREREEDAGGRGTAPAGASGRQPACRE